MLWGSSMLSEFHTSLSQVLTLWHCVKVKQCYLSHTYMSKGYLGCETPKSVRNHQILLLFSCKFEGYFFVQQKKYVVRFYHHVKVTQIGFVEEKARLILHYYFCKNVSTSTKYFQLELYYIVVFIEPYLLVSEASQKCI